MHMHTIPRHICHLFPTLLKNNVQQVADYPKKTGAYASAYTKL